MQELFQVLEENAIAYERFDHEPVFTTADVDRVIPDLPGAKTKNLFFRDQKGKRHFLVSMPDTKKVDIKGLAGALGTNRLRFGSPDRLDRYLGVKPGAVSFFSIFNDREGAVELIIDEELWEKGAFQFHPLVNTSTLVISKEAVSSFTGVTGHSVNVLAVPGEHAAP